MKFDEMENFYPEFVNAQETFDKLRLYLDSSSGKYPLPPDEELSELIKRHLIVVEGALSVIRTLLYDYLSYNANEI